MDLLRDLPPPPQVPWEIERDQMLVSGANLLERIGVGDYGIVYRAREYGSDRTISVKIIHFKEVDEEKVMQEARIHFSLRHKHIIRLYKYYVKQRSLILHMEYFNGVDLSFFIYSEQFNGKRYYVREKFLQGIESAFGHIHRHDIVHGDIHDSNVMVNCAGDVKVIDFGKAHHNVSKMSSDVQRVQILYDSINRMRK